MKLTDKFCLDCNIKLVDENWRECRKNNKEYRCNDCVKEKLKNGYKNRNTNRMFVNGKYIPQSHPLYKPGNYKTFEDAAFDALSKYTSSTEGQVYIITNKAWAGWIKVGMAIDSEDRCNQYQTSSPFRDYNLEYKKFFTDRRKAEQIAHALCNKKAQDRNGEWFKLDISTAVACIEKIKIEEQHEKETA